MKKAFFGLLLCLGLICPGATLGAGSNPVDQFTGKYWVETPEASKEAYLFGIDSAIAVEYFINDRLAEKNVKKGKKPVYTLSPFERGWMMAFRDTSRKELIKLVDDWYAAHPDSLDRPVMSVIWYEIIEPRLNAEKAKN